MLTMIPRALALAAMVLIGSAALAQTVYRSTMPDGRVIFGDAPAPGAAKVEPLNLPPPSTASPLVSPAEKERIQSSARDTAEKRREAQQQLEAARNELSSAQAALADGKEPLPGERLGIAGGGSRLSDDYWARQQRLKDAVTEAQQKIDAAQAALNSLR
jgi:hypothetical protein